MDRAGIQAPPTLEVLTCIIIELVRMATGFLDEL